MLPPNRLCVQALFFAITALFMSHSVNAEWVTDTQSIMGTRISLTFWHESNTQAQHIIQESMAEMRRIDAALSPYIESSELAQLNLNAAEQAQPISAEMQLLVDKSLYFSRASHGAFDITFASVGWYYDYRAKIQPSNKKRDHLLPAINYRNLKLNKQAHTLAYTHKNVRIDLGGVAKGYAVDRVAEILKSHGVESATVSAGGDSRIIGDKRGKPWMIGIKNPREQGEQSSPAIALPLYDVAVSTSGDYERYFIDEQSGERIHHIINPRTGKPTKGVASVTVLGPKGLDTDPMSTTVFVLGVEAGLAFVNKIPGFDCIIIDSHGTVFYSAGLQPPKL